jgi:hypothetical protein
MLPASFKDSTTHLLTPTHSLPRAIVSTGGSGNFGYRERTVFTAPLAGSQSASQRRNPMHRLDDGRCRGLDGVISRRSSSPNPTGNWGRDTILCVASAMCRSRRPQLVILAPLLDFPPPRRRLSAESFAMPHARGMEANNDGISLRDDRRSGGCPSPSHEEPFRCISAPIALRGAPIVTPAQSQGLAGLPVTRLSRTPAASPSWIGNPMLILCL